MAGPTPHRNLPGTDQRDLIALCHTRSVDGTTLRYELAPAHPTDAGQRPDVDAGQRPDCDAGDRPDPDGAAGGATVPVLFLHGSLSNRHAFRKLRPYLSGRPLLLTILRGHEGDNPTVGPDYSLAGTEVQDALTVLDAESVEQVDIVAHSTGGSIALALAAAHPQRVRRMVLIEPTLLPLLGGSVAERVRTDVAAMVGSADRGDEVLALRQLLDFVGGGSWRSATQDARDRVLEGMVSLAPLVGPHVSALAELAVSADDLTRLAPPTLLVYGTDSAYFEQPIAARLAELRPDLRQRHVEGAGHNAHLEQPAVVGPAAAAFLGAG